MEKNFIESTNEHISNFYVDKDFNLSEFIYQYRVSKGITQEDLAIISNLQQPQISRIEKNKNIKISTINKVLKSLDLKLISDEPSFYSFNKNKENLMIGSLIAYKRKIKKVTQQALADKTNLKQPQIVQIEKNNDLTLLTLIKLIKELELKLKIVKI
jgi:transcriptional regulator with XRE-family HTH domain